MRSILKIALPAAVSLCFAFWLVTAQIARASATPFWAYWWLSLVAVGAALCAGAWVALMLDDNSPRRGRGPDFQLERRGPQSFELTRLGRRAAFVVRQGDGQVSMSQWTEMGGPTVGDMQPGERLPIGMPNDSGCWLWLSWIESRGRYYTRSIFVDPSTTTLQVTGIYLEPGAKVQT